MISSESEKLLRSLITKHGLDAFADEIVAHAMECVVLTRGDPDDYSTVGNSRYGGVPDLPPGIPWPTAPVALPTRYTGFPRPTGLLTFLMQVNLAELPEIPGSQLPSSGILYYFMGTSETCLEVEKEVLYYDGPIEALWRCNEPRIEEMEDQEHGGLKPYQVRSSLGIDLPAYDHPFDGSVVNQVPDLDGIPGYLRFANFAAEAIGDPGGFSIQGKLLGYPADDEDEMLANAYMVDLGGLQMMYDKDKSPEQKAISQAGAEEWTHLWSIESDFEVGTCFWDAGTLYTMIRKEDLRNKKFNRTWTQLETS